jgi:RIO kinase 1
MQRIEERTMSLPALEIFQDEGWITDVSQQVKSGKEATVYCCQATPLAGGAFLAAKIYRDRRDRTFRNDAIYQTGRLIRDSRLRRAAANKSAAGRSAQFSSWIEHEFATLTLLHAIGADVPRPIACAASGTLLEYVGEPTPRRRRALGVSANAILMQYIGEADTPAPHLQHAPMEREEARPLFERIIGNVALWLSYDRVHSDLSAFNILYWQGDVTIIDFPQAVDPCVNPNAQALLTRDVENVCRYFARYGVRADPTRLADSLWRRYLSGDL